MKKLIITIAAAVIATVTASAQLSVGAGYISNPMKSTVAGVSITENYSGFYVGADYLVTKLGPVAVTPGVYFTDYKWVENITSEKLLNLEIPVNFSYGIDFGTSVRGFVYAGPTFRFGLSAKSTTGSLTEDLYKASSNFSRFNLFLGGGVGVDIVSKVRVTFGYNAGLLDRMQHESGRSLTESNLHVGVAYLF